jgi:hypothetical protein
MKLFRSQFKASLEGEMIDVSDEEINESDTLIRH